MIVKLAIFKNDYILHQLKKRDLKYNNLNFANEEIIFQVEKWKKDNLRYNTKTGILRSDSEKLLSGYGKDNIPFYNSTINCFEGSMLNDLYCFIINKNWW
jgi:hypothetical protein